MIESTLQGIELSVNFLAKGGVFIIPIVASSLIAVALIIDRLWYYHRARCQITPLYARLTDLVKKDQIPEALALCENQRGILPRVFSLVLRNRDRSEQDIEKLISVAGTREIQQLSKHVRGLGIIGHVTPLMGLLGTVVGMVKTFMQIADLSGHVNPSLLAGGIWEALLTTAAGLTVAIPVVIIYHYFEGIVERFAFQMKNYSLELIDLLKDDRV
ncbi:MotA/TolQ/ExbB proton channel family protein [candidate division KSB3 bacterium]|uniref:MotA/TolQ/ExbB proton channel family protein n=1 Tax=candidate division KSB3 bacterium TaxID=2044937 RepID=A0A9D5JZ37_9BACT|nr:MotA/TolQ/ExbB proton channel family protein [candidate division KSB3 bacterium]MBD3326452.1 MotA/TolQ/ExbB proton channel family protein [candidate division KSB3 bacterium]